MEIEIKQIQKESNCGELPKMALPILGLTDNKITLSEVVDMVVISQVITLEPKDILKLMTWLIGQEEHTQRELIHKDRENKKMVDADINTYAILKEDIKSLDLQLQQDGEDMSIEAVHTLHDVIKNHRKEMTKLEVKFKYYTGRDIPYKEK